MIFQIHQKATLRRHVTTLHHISVIEKESDTIFVYYADLLFCYANGLLYALGVCNLLSS